MKKIIAVVMLIAIVFLCASCDSVPKQYGTGNRVTQGADYQTFHYAYIVLGDRLIAEGEITQWRDYQSGDEIQINIGGKVYLTHYSNVVMVTDAQSQLNYGSYQDRMPTK